MLLNKKSQRIAGNDTYDRNNNKRDIATPLISGKALTVRVQGEFYDRPASAAAGS